MENHCVVVIYSLRVSKKNKQGLSPIEVSISYNRERIYFSTGKFIKPSEWNKQKQMVKGYSHFPKSLFGLALGLSKTYLPLLALKDNADGLK